MKLINIDRNVAATWDLAWVLLFWNFYTFYTKQIILDTENKRRSPVLFTSLVERGNIWILLF